MGFKRKVLFTDFLNVNDKFLSKDYRGSTPFIELECKLWITMVHKRIKIKNRLIYKYYYQIYNNKEITINNTIVNIPNKCIQEILFDESKIYSNKFIFIMGMIIHNQNYHENNLKLQIILSYGISDMQSGISLFNLITQISK